MTKKTIEENGFMDHLEKNYGVYLEVDNFIKEMKNKLNNIKSYKQLFEYLGSDFANNKTNLEIIKDAYEKAKLKKYVENDKIKKKKDKKEKNQKKEKKPSVNFDDDEDNGYIEDYNDSDYDDEEDEDEEGEESEDV